jgi:hypothetical protein
VIATEKKPETPFSLWTKKNWRICEKKGKERSSASGATQNTFSPRRN